jgi:hypothetical protein
MLHRFGYNPRWRQPRNGDKPRSIIMPNDDRAIVGRTRRFSRPTKRRSASSRRPSALQHGANKYNISRDEAVSIAVQIGQEVYDQLRAEHAMTMAELQKDAAGQMGVGRRLGLELHGLKSVPEEPETERGGMYEDFFGEEAENVGAPSELPEAPEIARTFVVTGD